MPMRVGDRGADLAEELQPLGDVERSAVAVLVDRLPFDVLHHEVRQAVLGRAAVEQARDVRVIEARRGSAARCGSARSMASVSMPRLMSLIATCFSYWPSARRAR